MLYLINGLGTGGSERSLADMLPGLRDAGIEVIVACLHRRAEGVEREVLAAGFDVRFLRPRSLAGRVVAVHRLLRALRPDLLHTTHFESDLAGRLAAWGSGVPVLTSLVVDRHDPARADDPRLGSRRRRQLRLLDGWTTRHLTDHLHAVCAPVRDAALATLRVDPARVTVVERGRRPPWSDDLQRAVARKQTRAALGLADDAEVILNTGRHEYQKGQRTLLAALSDLAPGRPRLVLLVAGRQGHATDELAALATRLAIASRVRFLGHRDDVPALLAAADLFAFPSLYEGLPGSVVEAMAAGLPIVASAIPAHESILEDGGNALLLPPLAADRWAEAIASLLDDRERRARFGARGRELYAQRFTLERAVGGMVQLYRRLVPAAKANAEAATR
ncbi:MAG TPA: glycosyltransferase [Thermoanaerobaculia bacterium]|nr:glycosyltransferase [Thermoanaerobaculia bacterium]